MGISKTSDHIQIKIKMPNPSQEPPAPGKAPNQDIKDMDVLCTFKIKIESQNLEHGTWDKWQYPNQDKDTIPYLWTFAIIQSFNSRHRGNGCSLQLQNQDRAKIWNMGVSKTSDHFQIMITMSNSSQEPPAPSKAPNQDLKDIDVLWTFKIKIESQNF